MISDILLAGGQGVESEKNLNSELRTNLEVGGFDNLDLEFFWRGG
jgi:hypothetical protein